MIHPALNIVVLISGNGSNLQAIIDAAESQQLNINVLGVISNIPDVYGLKRAELAGIKTETIPHKQFTSREAFDHTLKQHIDHYAPDLIVLAGFMRRLTPEIVRAYHGKMINIHPSLLPKYPGLNTHKRVLEAGDKQHGCSIHFVTDAIDSGPIISQMKLDIKSDDTEESLKARVQVLEHQLYPETLKWFADRQIKLVDNKVFLKNKLLTP